MSVRLEFLGLPVLASFFAREMLGNIIFYFCMKHMFTILFIIHFVTKVSENNLMFNTLL